MERCALCGKGPTKSSPLNNHHYKGRKNSARELMRVHVTPCHIFADWVTALFIKADRLDELTPGRIVYIYARVMSMPDPLKLVLPRP